MDEAVTPGHRCPARAADVPALRRGRRARADREGHERLARRRRRQGGLRLRHRRRVGRARRGRDPGPPGDQPRRPARHGRRPRHPHQPRRQDLARRRGGPRHGPHLRVRRRLADHRRRSRKTRTRRTASRSREGDADLDRRHHRRGVRRRGAGGRLAGRAHFEGDDDEPRATSWSPRSPGSWSTPTRPAGSRSAPTPTPPTTRRGPAGSARRASGCAAPSTCSSASGRRWWRR